MAGRFEPGWGGLEKFLSHVFQVSEVPRWKRRPHLARMQSRALDVFFSRIRRAMRAV